MTQEDALNVINKLHVLVLNRIEYKNHIWRKGQTYFNLFHYFYPDIADQIRNTENDCFYRDDKIDAFILKALELLVSNNAEIAQW